MGGGARRKNREMVDQEPSLESGNATIASTGRVISRDRSSRAGVGQATVTQPSESEISRRRAAAERMRGLFADVAPDRSLVDELIADRRAEAAAESGESVARQRLD